MWGTWGLRSGGRKNFKINLKFNWYFLGCLDNVDGNVCFLVLAKSSIFSFITYQGQELPWHTLNRNRYIDSIQETWSSIDLKRKDISKEALMSQGYVLFDHPCRDWKQNYHWRLTFMISPHSTLKDQTLPSHLENMHPSKAQTNITRTWMAYFCGA